MLAPVGRAWESAAATAKDLELYESDGSHPNACGAWLAAAVLYTAMFGGDPKTIPASLDARERDVSRVLVTLKPHEAATLREAATSVLAPRQGAKVPKTRKDRQQTR
jgi:hypothetical protein